MSPLVPIRILATVSCIAHIVFGVDLLLTNYGGTAADHKDFRGPRDDWSTDWVLVVNVVAILIDTYRFLMREIKLHTQHDILLYRALVSSMSSFVVSWPEPGPLKDFWIIMLSTAFVVDIYCYAVARGILIHMTVAKLSRGAIRRLQTMYALKVWSLWTSEVVPDGICDSCRNAIQPIGPVYKLECESSEQHNFHLECVVVHQLVSEQLDCPVHNATSLIV
jgi:hypothetical protein